MKRPALIRHLTANGCVKIREGRSHTIYENAANGKRAPARGTMRFLIRWCAPFVDNSEFPNPKQAAGVGCYFPAVPAALRPDLTRNPGGLLTLAIPLTSRQSALRFRACHVLQPSARNGLSVPSVALVFQLAAIDIRNVGAQIGELDDADRLILQELTRRVCGLP